MSDIKMHCRHSEIVLITFLTHGSSSELKALKVGNLVVWVDCTTFCCKFMANF